MCCEVLRYRQDRLLLPLTEWSTMAQKIQTLFIDDIDGGEAEGTVRFGLDGAEYEIDLSAAHDAELRSALGKYVSHARKVTARGTRPAGRGAGRRPSPVDTTAVRAWARENGIDIKERGRVPADVMAKYQAAVGALAAGTPLQKPGHPARASEARRHSAAQAGLNPAPHGALPRGSLKRPPATPRDADRRIRANRQSAFRPWALAHIMQYWTLPVSQGQGSAMVTGLVA
jgi:hypothetical protein